MRASDQLAAIYQRRRAAVYALCLGFAGYALAKFREEQPAIFAASGEYWTNQTTVAAQMVFSDAFSEGDAVGWFLAHGVEYGVYLELANDRQNEALRPIVEEFFPKFMQQVRAIYAD